MNRTVKASSHVVARRSARSDEDPRIVMPAQCNVTQLTFRAALRTAHSVNVDVTLTRSEASAKKSPGRFFEQKTLVRND
jgi:hypothetical protein